MAAIRQEVSKETTALPRGIRRANRTNSGLTGSGRLMRWVGVPMTTRPVWMRSPDCSWSELSNLTLSVLLRVSAMMSAIRCEIRISRALLAGKTR